MSILIKGINKPTDARNCKFYDTDPLGIRKPYCAIQSVCNGLDSCPLVELPPHGRLIDADVLKDSIANIKHIDNANPHIMTAWREINLAPTIIEADYLTDTVHFGKVKGNSITTDRIEAGVGK